MAIGVPLLIQMTYGGESIFQVPEAFSTKCDSATLAVFAFKPCQIPDLTSHRSGGEPRYVINGAPIRRVNRAL